MGGMGGMMGGGGPPPGLGFWLSIWLKTTFIYPNFRHLVNIKLF